MTETLTRDADTLHRALATSGDQVQLTVSRETAEWIAELVDAKVSGRAVVLTNDRGEVSPTQAGRLLGMSRPQVRKLMDDRRLDYRKIGTHHRITVASIQAFLAAEDERRAPILAELARLQNDAGLVV
jgi:excisionase family DNA binding protein